MHRLNTSLIHSVHRLDAGNISSRDEESTTECCEAIFNSFRVKLEFIFECRSFKVQRNYLERRPRALQLDNCVYLCRRPASYILSAIFYNKPVETREDCSEINWEHGAPGEFRHCAWLSKSWTDHGHSLFVAMFSCRLHSEAQNSAFSIKRWKISVDVVIDRVAFFVDIRSEGKVGEKGRTPIINRKMISDSETDRWRR